MNPFDHEFYDQKNIVFSYLDDFLKTFVFFEGKQSKVLHLRIEYTAEAAEQDSSLERSWVGNFYIQSHNKSIQKNRKLLNAENEEMMRFKRKKEG